jgi:hypothetical protein
MIEMNNDFVLMAVSLIEFLIFFVYLPLKFYKNKLSSFFSVFVGVILLVIISYQTIFIIANELFNLNVFTGVIGLLIIGVFIGSIMAIFIFYFEGYTKLHDCGLNGILSVFLVWFYKKKNKKLVEEKSKTVYYGFHSAAIIAIKKGLIFEDDTAFADGIDLLVKHFRVKHHPFYIYVCKTPEEARQVIKNDKIRKIWIFGHGAMYGLYFGKNGLLNYKEFIDAAKNKDFIGQFHCNSHPECGYSLADLVLSADGKKFVKEGYRCIYQNRIAIEKGIKKDWNCESI